jgi:hypothetical protein
VRVLGLILLSTGLLSFIFTLSGVRLLPPQISSPEIAVIALAAGILLVWLGERASQRRKWKGLDRRPKYFD